MDEDIRLKPTPQKVIIIYNGERPTYAAFIDAAQEKRILQILDEHRRRIAH